MRGGDYSGILSGGGVVVVVAAGVDAEAGLEDADCEAEPAPDELGAVLVAVGGLELVLGLEVVEAARDLGVWGRSTGNGVTCLRATADLPRCPGSRATRSSMAQLPSKTKHSTDDRTLRIAKSVVTRPLECPLVDFSTLAT